MSLHPALRVICGVLALAVWAGASHAADEAERTVFWPPDFHGTQPPAPPVANLLDRFEFRGVLTIGSETFVTLIDTATRRALTTALGDTIDGVTLAAFQSETGSILLTAGDRSKRLEMPDAKIVAIAPVNFYAPTQKQVGFEGLRRRREMRRQMLEAQSPPVAPASTR